jgi:hypothetical protein
LLGNPVTVVVALSSKLPAGTGTITLLEGSTVLGTTTLVRRESSAPAGAIGNTSVSSLFQLSTLSAGTHSLTATYSGDTNYTPATAVSNLALTIADATVTLPTASQTIPAGGSATYAFNIAAVGGFNGSVAFTCSGLPTGYACGSSSVTVSGPTATASVTVSPLKAQQGPQPFGPAGIAIGTASVMFLWLGRRRLTGHLLVLVAMVSFTALSGCSSGSSSSTNTTSPGTPPATPVATNFTITATITLGSGTITRTVPATLIVQ